MGKGPRVMECVNRREVNKGGSVKSSASGKPRKRPWPAEQDEDVEDYDSGHGSYEDDGGGYDESNSFAPP